MWNACESGVRVIFGIDKKQDEWNAKLIVEKFLQHTEDFEGKVMLMSMWHWFTHYNLYFSATEFLNGD